MEERELYVFGADELEKSKLPLAVREGPRGSVLRPPAGAPTRRVDCLHRGGDIYRSWSNADNEWPWRRGFEKSNLNSAIFKSTNGQTKPLAEARVGEVGSIEGMEEFSTLYGVVMCEDGIERMLPKIAEKDGNDNWIEVAYSKHNDNQRPTYQNDAKLKASQKRIFAAIDRLNERNLGQVQPTKQPASVLEMKKEIASENKAGTFEGYEGMNTAERVKFLTNLLNQEVGKLELGKTTGEIKL